VCKCKWCNPDPPDLKKLLSYSLKTLEESLRRIYPELTEHKVRLTARLCLMNRDGTDSYGNLRKESVEALVGDVYDDYVRKLDFSEGLGKQVARELRGMIKPLRERLDYQSFGHKTFLVECMPEGELPIYPKEGAE